MEEARDRWRSIQGRVFTSGGAVHEGTLSRHPEDTSRPAVWVECAIYGPGDEIDGQRIIGFKADDGGAYDLAMLFNVEARRTR